MDRLRLIYFGANGRPVTVRDLNDGANVAVIRDSLSFVPGQSNTQTSASGRRWEGAEVVSETRDNGVFECEFYVGDGTSSDAAIDIAEAISAEFADTGGNYFIEWRPDGASHSRYSEIRCAQPPALKYRWVEWSGTKRLHMAVQVQIAPLAVGDQTWIYEDWARPDRVGTPGVSNAGLDEYTVTDPGHVPPAVYVDANQRLVFTTGGLKTLLFTGRGYQYEQGESALTVTIGASATGSSRLILGQTASGDVIYARWNYATQNVEIRKKVSGVDTQIATASTSTLAAGTYTFRASRIINGSTGSTVVRADLFPLPADNDPELWFPNRTAIGASSSARVSTTLTTGDAAIAATGSYGFAIDPVGDLGTQKVVRWRFEPYTAGFNYNGSQPSASFVPGENSFGLIPGTAPALLDVDVTVDVSTTVTSSGSLGWSLLSWWDRPTLTPTAIDAGSNGIAQASPPFGFWDADTTTYPTWFGIDPIGFTSTSANIAASGGNLLWDSSVGSPDYWQFHVMVDPSVVEPDEFTNEVKVELWARVYQSGGLTSLTATASALPFGAGELAFRYTSEWGSSGRLVPTAAGWRVHRLGIISLPVDKHARSPWLIVLRLIAGNGSSGTFGLDWLAGVPVRSRAVLPTSKVQDASYPKFIPGGVGNVATRRIYSDLTGASGGENAPPNWYSMTRGMSGAPLIINGGARPQVLVLTSDQVPDDPSLPSGENTTMTNQPMYVSMHVQPRYHLARGT
jgi:hypothetical protein